MATKQITTPILDSSISNLTITQLPPDNTNIVFAPPKQKELSDRVSELLEKYATTIVQKPSPEACPSSISAAVPRALLTDLRDILSITLNGCTPETDLLISAINGLLTDTPSTSVNVSRAFFNQVGRCLSELSINEIIINKMSAALRAMCMPISNDAQTIATDEMLLTTMEEIQKGEEWVDPEFKEENSEYIETSPIPEEILSEVLTQNPQTVGESGSETPSNTVELGNLVTNKEIQIIDVDDPNSVQYEAIKGLKELFSSITLNTPLRDMKLIFRNLKKLSAMQPITGNWVCVQSDAKDSASTATWGDLQKILVPLSNSTIMVDAPLDVSLIPMDKSLLDQDWVIELPPTFARNYESPNLRKYRNMDYMAIHEIATFLMEHPQMFEDESLKFIGYKSRRVMNGIEVYKLSSALQGAWKAVSSIKMPSLGAVTNATNILSLGLGAIGQITGSSGLVKASNITGVLGAGLGAFLPPSTASRVATVDPVACILKNSLNIVPCLIDAGAAQLEQHNLPAQTMRLLLSGQKNVINASYAIPNPNVLYTPHYKRKIQQAKRRYKL